VLSCAGHVMQVRCVLAVNQTATQFALTASVTPARWRRRSGVDSPGAPPLSAGANEFLAKKIKNNFPVTVKISTSLYQTLECFIATLPT